MQARSKRPRSRAENVKARAVSSAKMALALVAERARADYLALALRGMTDVRIVLGAKDRAEYAEDFALAEAALKRHDAARAAK